MGEIWRASIEGLTGGGGGGDDGTGAAQLFIGSETPFNWAVFHFEQTASKVRGMTAKYWNVADNAWTEIPEAVDETRGFSQNGAIHWPSASIDMGLTTVNSSYQYWLLIESTGEPPVTLPTIYSISAFLLDLEYEDQDPPVDESNLVWLLEVDWLSGLERYSTKDIRIAGIVWNGRISGTPAVNRRISDILFGSVEIQDLALSLIHDGPETDDFGFLDIVLDEARGCEARLYRYDEATSIQLLEWTGTITACEVLPTIVNIEGSSIDPTFFQMDIPSGESEIDAERWPLAHDIGAAIPLVFGKVNLAKLPLINNDPINSVFDYMAGYAPTTIRALYRAAPREGKFEEVNALNDVIVESTSSKTNAVGTSPSSNTLTFEHPGGGLPDQALMVAVVTKNAIVSSITTDGNPLTRLSTRNTSSGGRLELWYLLAPAPSSSTILITLSATAVCTAAAVTFSHVDQTMTAPDFLATTTGIDGLSGSVTITKGEFDTVFSFLGYAIENEFTQFRSTSGREIFSDGGSANLTFITYFQLLGQVITTHLDGAVSSSYSINPTGSFGIIGIRLRSTPTYIISDTFHPGYTVVRFSEPQTDSSDNFIDIRADLNGNMDARNFAVAFQEILSNETWGAGKDVNAASFAETAALLDDVGEMFCDGIVLEKTQLQDLLAQLFPVRGFVLGRDGDGFTLTMPTEATSIRYRMTSGNAKGPSPIVQTASKRRAPKTDAIKTVILKYRKDLVSNEYLVTIERPIRKFGVEKTYEMPFISVHRTADKALDFLAKLHIAADNQMGLTLAPEAMDIFESELIDYTYLNLGIDRFIMQIAAVNRELAQQQAELIGWTPAILSYVESDPFPPPDFVIGSRADFSRIAPDPIQDFEVTGDSLSGEDPNQQASVNLRWTTPTMENYLETVIRYRESTAIGWTFGGVVNTVGISTITISGLLPDTTYDFIAFARNKFGLRSAVDALIAGYSTPIA